MVRTTTKRGFTLPKHTARLQFEGDYEGAEVVVSLDLSFGLVLDAQQLADNSDPQLLGSIFDRFNAEALIEWNLLDDEGNPIPTHPDGLKTIPFAFATLILTNTTAAIGEISPPLESPSPNGSTATG